MRSLSLKFVAAVVPMAIAVSAGLSLAAPTTIFSDDFEGNTASFAYPDTVGHPPVAPAVGSWEFSDATNPYIAAGQITNATPGSGAGGSAAYMAMERAADPINGGTLYYNKAAAVFSMPVTAANGTLDVQWDQYTTQTAYDVSLNSSSGFAWQKDATFNRFSSNGNGNLQVYWDGYNSNASAGTIADLQWAHMEIKMDLATLTYQIFANNTQLGTTWQYQYAPAAGEAINRLNFGGTFDGSELFIDNVTATVSQVPEPMTGGLMLLSGGLLLLKSRKTGRSRTGG
jgi:hypothetical protein